MPKANLREAKKKTIKPQKEAQTKLIKKEKAQKMAADVKHISEVAETKKKLLKKIEDFNQFHQEKEAEINATKKQLTKKLKLNKNLIMQAVECVKQLATKIKTDNPLMNVEDEFIYIELTLATLPETYSIRPHAIKLPHAIYSPEYFSKHAVIVRTPQREYKDLIAELNVPCIGKVIGYDKLLKNYQRYEQKRDLCKEFELFFCDYRVYDLLRKPLGKVFYDRKKIPFPIDCQKAPEYSGCSSYESYINSLNEYTYFVQGNGPNYTLKVARVTMENQSIQENIVEAILSLASHLLTAGDLDNSAIRRICLKTSKSPSLPIYSHLSEKERNKLSDAIALM